MSLASRKLIQATAGATTVDTGDDDFANVVLLLDGDGTSDDDNSTFTNSGSTVTTIGTTGDVVQGSFSPYGDHWSVYFDGSSYLDTASGATALGTGAFTVEFWINTTDTSFNIMNPDSSTGNGFWGLMVQNGDLRWNNQYALTNLWVVDGAPILDGQWHHVAIVSSSSVFKVFYDGVSQSIQSGSFNDSYNYPYNDGLRIGNGNLNNFTGYLSNIRLVSGTAIYSSNFDIPTEPFTNSTSYTEKLLACQSNRFIDNGNSEYAITTSGHPKVTPFSPFKNDDARDITVDGGSAYFAGSGDHVDITDNNDLDFGTGDFTIEFWAYIDTGTNNQDGLISKGNTGTGWQIVFTGDESLKFIRTSGNASSPQITSSDFSVVEFQWHHIALTRSGTTVTLWINGVSEGTYTDSTSWDTSEPLRIGTNRGENNDYVGYISDVRVFKGRAIYDSAFTVPSAPLSTIGGVNEIIGMSYSGTSFSAQSQESAVQGIRFGDSGTKMYVIGNGTDSVYQYTLTTAYDISTASYASKSFSVATQDSTPKGVAFKSDGTKMYVCGQTSQSILQYSLSTAWDVSTASYDSVSKDISGSDTTPQDITFKPDGTRMYFCGNTTDDVYQMDLSTPWDVSTATGSDKLDGDDSIVQGHVLNSDGTRLYVCGMGSDGVYQYNLSTAWDITTGTDAGFISTASQEGAPRALEINPDGTQFFVAGTGSDTVFEYDLSTVTPELLLNFQDAGIYDRSGINNIDTVGDARLGFAPIYGTGSLAFDGTGDYLDIRGSEELILGTADFTVEGWFYANNFTNRGTFVDSRGPSSASGLTIGHEASTGEIRVYMTASSGSDIVVNSTNFSASQWTHIAVTRESGTVRLFVDGNLEDSATRTTNLSNNHDYYIGYKTYTSSSYSYFNGYIDDLRITKGVARYTSAFTPPTEIDLSTDTHREYVTLFLDGDGTVNGQNNTFTDGSTNGATVTENGSVVQGVFSPYGDNWSNYFNSADERLDFTPSFSLGSNNFTIEMWVNPSALDATSLQTFFWLESGTNDFIALRVNNNGNAGFEFRVYNGSNQVLITQGSDYLENGEWVHVAATKSGSTYNFFVNGTSVGTATYATALTSYTNGHIGAWTSVSQDYAGYVSNVRVVNGTALYTSNFTPPTGYLTAVTNTVLLTCQSNRFVDNASSPHTLTPGVAPKVTRFSPFESNKPYDITTDGGSGHFDGSGAYLTVPGSSDLTISSGEDFTLEVWLKLGRFPDGVGSPPANNGDNLSIFGQGEGSWSGSGTVANFHWNLDYDSATTVRSTFGLSGGYLQLTGISVAVGEWHHWAISGTSGGTATLYIDGVSQGSTSSLATFGTNTSFVNHIGLQYYGTAKYANYFQGEMADMRLTVGSKLYTSNFTPPTAPLTAVTNTELLLNFQDSAIPDLSGLNNIDTVGNAKVNGTDPTKYGSNAIQFDGTGDYLTFDSQLDELSFGTGDFTIEGWFYIQSGDEYPYAFDFRNTGSQAAPALYFYNYGNGSIDYYVSGSSRILGTSAGNDVWQHIAVCRSGTSTKMFVNGTQSGSTYTDSTNYVAYSGNIGIKYDNVRPFKGFMDDLRITKGVARYTSNFTAPTKALPKF